MVNKKSTTIIGMVSGVLGTLFSSMYTQTPTGPAIIIVLSIIIFISLLFAPRRGLLATRREHRLKRRRYSEAMDKNVTR